VNDSPRLCSSCSHWDSEPGKEEGGLREGMCRRFPPVSHVAAGVGPDHAGWTEWPRTLDRDWCGEWRLCEELPIDQEEERQLRNIAMAQALLVLSPETRDQVLREVLAEDEMGCPSPPEDFYERVQRYFAVRKDGG
jgi:hypothetical protein